MDDSCSGQCRKTSKPNQRTYQVSAFLLEFLKMGVNDNHILMFSRQQGKFMQRGRAHAKRPNWSFVSSSDWMKLWHEIFELIGRQSRIYLDN